MDTEKKKSSPTSPSPVTPHHDAHNQFEHTPSSIRNLIRDCAQQSSQRRAPPIEPDPCYKLFCLALGPSPNQMAWDAIVKQYERLVRHWLGQYSSDDTCQEVFLRFWRAQENKSDHFANRFPNIKTVIQYLKRCAVTVRIESHREESLHQLLQERLAGAMRAELVSLRPRSDQWAAEFDLRQLVLAKLKNEQEKIVFEATYRRGLPPREIQAEQPDIFPNTQTVHRIKENLLKRLRRDQELQVLWAEADPEDDAHGGKTPHLTI